MNNKKEIIVIVSIDTECDKGPGWEIQQPLRFTSVTEGIPQKLTPLFNTYGIKPTYLLSPEIIQDVESVEVLQSLKDCELGTHLHGEFVNPESENVIDRTKTPQLSYPPNLEYEKLKQLTLNFERTFGYRPKSFRAGRFGISHHTINFLEGLGYRVDSSVTPFRKIQFDEQNNVNFWGAPYHPYYPSRSDITKVGNTRVLEVPVSTIIPAYANLPFYLQRLVGKNPSLSKRILRKFRYSKNLYELIYLRPLRASSEGLIEGAEQIIQLWQGNTQPVLNIMFHSVEVMRGCSPYSQEEKSVQYFFYSLEQLFDHLNKSYHVLSMKLSEIYDMVQPKFVTESKK